MNLEPLNVFHGEIKLTDLENTSEDERKYKKKFKKVDQHQLKGETRYNKIRHWGKSY